MNQSVSSLNDCENSKKNTAVLLQNERLSLLHKGIPVAILGNITLALILTYIQTPAFPLEILLVWLSAMILILVWRAFIFYQLKRQSTKLSPAEALIRFRISTIATALAWASVPIFLFPENNIAIQTTLSFLLAGVSAGAASSLSIDKVSAFGFIFPPLLALTAAFLMEGGKESITMAVMTMLF